MVRPRFRAGDTAESKQTKLLRPTMSEMRWMVRGAEEKARGIEMGGGVAF